MVYNGNLFIFIDTFLSKRNNMRINDKDFALLVDKGAIQLVVEQTCGVIRGLDLDNVVFVVMANGANWFAQKLFNMFPTSVFDIEYALLKSYSGSKRHAIQEIKLPDIQVIQGKTVVILEDFIDSGHTVEYMIQWCNTVSSPKGVCVCPMCIRDGVDATAYHVINEPYCIPKGKWIVGCGLDFDHFGRNLSDIYYMIE